MQVIIPAAGMGSRLGELTKNNTKCLVEVNGKTLISRALKNIYLAGIKKVVLIIGFEGDKLKKALGYKYKDVEITYVENKYYDTTNNIYSIFLAKDEIEKDDSIILESDIIFDKNLLIDLIKDKNKNLVVADEFESWMDGSVVTIDSKKNVKKFFSRNEVNLDKRKEYFKTVNIYKFSKKFLKEIYFPILSIFVSKGHLSEYYESPLKIVPHTKFNILKIFLAHQYKWHEIDDIQDLDLASIKFLNSKKAFEAISKRYGGLWRFPSVLDYCYLVNPYFPNEQLKKELKFNLEALIGSYPSTQFVQSMIASRLFKIDTKYLIVGNGGAEIINEIGRYFNSKFNLFSPTFKEYEQRFKDKKINVFSTNNFHYDVKNFLKESDDKNGLILVNPDNPSGSFIEKEDIINFLSRNKKQTIIIDESFIDFSDKKHKYSLIDKDLLIDHPNLFVLKSIGKSYGVGGLRLGVLASGNEKVLKEISTKLSIWNINSLAENFLQIAPKYQNEFELSCEMIEKERNYLYKKLLNIPFLKPFPSQANYIFCEVKKLNARELCEKMLEKYKIFIKLYEHKNFDNHIRLSIRSREDNLRLLSAFKSFHDER